MLRKKRLAVSVLFGACFSLPALSQDVPETPGALDVTLTVVEDGEDVQDLINNIELPAEARAIAGEAVAAVVEAVRAAEGLREKRDAEREAVVQEALARSQTLIADAALSADVAREEALRAAEATREIIEEAVRNALSGGEVEGLIEQLMRDIFDNLPDDIKSQLPEDLYEMIDEARSGLLEEPEG